MIVRRATPADAPCLVEFGRDFAAASPYTGCADVSASAVEAFMQIPNIGFWIAEDGGRPVGACGAVLFPLWWAEDVRLCQELFWWITPEARGTGAAAGLLRAMEDWARENGARYHFMVCLEDENAGRVGKLYRRAGYRPTEHSFLKEL